MKIRCQCGAIYIVPETTCGKNVKCKKCGTTFLCPTPPRKLNASAAAPAANQNVPGTFVTSPYAKSKTAQRSDAEQDAILKKYMSEESSLEDRMRDRRADSIEQDRTSNAVSYLIVGTLWIVAAVVIGIALFATSRAMAGGGGRVLIILWVLTGIGAQYWLPPLVALVGVYKITIGIMALFGAVDIQSQEQLPERF